MTLKSILSLGATFAILLIISCGEKVERPTPILTPEQVQQNQSQFQSPVVPEGGVTSGVMHYTCPNGHDGSNTQGACITCGATLVHNQAFHDQPAAATPPAAGAEPAQNTVGVWHYTCPNGHEGGSGSATACPECGTTLVHNTAYHNEPSITNPTSTPLPPSPPPSTPEPAQNAAGVWHYTCPNGHDGGSGSATACPECGTTLTHNQAYHN